MRFRGRARRARRAAVDLTHAVDPRVQLAGLLDVVDAAIALQPAADEVITACSWPGETPVWVARRGGEVASAYCRLYGWAAELSRNAGPDSVPVRATQLISYHATMVDMCLKLAFPSVLSPRLDRRRLALDGLGEPAAILRDLRVVLAMCRYELDD
jgi:hypothetical protein